LIESDIDRLSIIISVGSLVDLLVVGYCRPDRCAVGLSRRSVVF